MAKEKEFNFKLIELYFRKKEHESALQVISEQTINDIDFKTVFVHINRTCSRIGQQYSYDQLLTINTEPDFDEQEQLIRRLMENYGERTKIRSILSKISDEKAYYLPQLLFDAFIYPPGYFPLLRVLSIASIATCIVTILFHQFIWVLILFFCVNMIFHYINKKNIHLYSDSIPQLALLCKLTGALQRYKLPVEATETVRTSLKKLDRLKSRFSLFILEARSSDPLLNLPWLIIEYLKIQFLFEPLIVFNVLKKLRDNQKDIRNIYDYFAKVDNALSVATLREEIRCHCRPVIDKAYNGISFTDIYHPLVLRCIPNTMTVEGKSVLLTGSNMSGKSTFIRCVAINALLAQTINTCFAKEFHMSPLRIFSAIRISDNVMSGKSYYFEKVATIKETIRESQAEYRSLILLDEIYKGTNTIERIAAGQAVLSYMHRNGNIVFVSTHDIELTGLLKESFDLYHFSESVEGGAVHFDYKLKAGPLKTRNAIKILEINGYPEEIIRQATNVSNKVVHDDFFQNNGGM